VVSKKKRVVDSVTELIAKFLRLEWWWFKDIICRLKCLIIDMVDILGFD